ncbi:hypothetical protein HNY73_021105 [Argiope bruennichi]|uniref:Uncharacterized protein n=1 Tax=Argiope bruennichi TaxID=94029 RepID=A0A8T0EDN3_ARGBR|nr:hypothetical protein HNY73_021105 [Argiope bruennichi]
MGVGGSTSRPNSATIIMSNKRPQTSSSDHSITRESSGAHSSPPDNRPTNSCCSHYRENHAGVTRTVTPADPAQKDDSIDDEIEEIVANTLDLVSNQRTSRQPTPHLRDTDRGGGGGGMVMRRDVTSSAASSGSGQRRLLQRSESTRILQKRPSDEDSDSQYDAKDSTPEVDFAKFKKVNHQAKERNLIGYHFLHIKNWNTMDKSILEQKKTNSRSGQEQDQTNSGSGQEQDQTNSGSGQEQDQTNSGSGQAQDQTNGGCVPEQDQTNGGCVPEQDQN